MDWRGPLMPIKFLLFLKNLDAEEADELWEWLDGNFYALDDIIDAVAETLNRKDPL